MAGRAGAIGAVAALAVVGATTLALAPFVGMEAISPADLGEPEGVAYRIFWSLRVPRVGLAWLAGIGLALAGMTFQSLFRNALATPFTLGVASGASLGATLAIRLGLSLVILGVSGVSLAALVGALLAIMLVYGLTRLRRGSSTATMLLAGVAVGFICSSAILFIQYVSDYADSFRIVRWLMGGLQAAGYDTLLGLLPFLVCGVAVIAWHCRELDLLSLGDELAASRGVAVERVRFVLFFATSLLVAGVVSVCGPIGFVGMMSPHICRLLVGPDHRALLPATALFGGLFLTLCDLLARTLIAPAEIPVGVITALLGGPFFLWLLLRGSSDRSLL